MDYSHPKGFAHRIKASVNGLSTGNIGPRHEMSFTDYAAQSPPHVKRRWWMSPRTCSIRSHKPPVPAERTVSPEYGASFLSLLTFQWMAALISKGHERALESNDLYLVNPERAVRKLSAKFEASLDKRICQGDRYPLFWALHETFKFEFWLGGSCQLVTSMLQVLTPFTLRYLIAFATQAYVSKIRGSAGPPIIKGVGIVVGITLMQMLSSLCASHAAYRGQMVGAQSRAVLTVAIFRKSMKLSGRAKAGGKAETDEPKAEPDPFAAGSRKRRSRMYEISQKLIWFKNGIHSPPKVGKVASSDRPGYSNGRLVSLMSTDSGRIDVASAMFHMIWTSPVAITLALVLLLVNISYSALAGFALLCIGVPALAKPVKFLFAQRKAIQKVTDERVSLTQEAIAKIRTIKLFGWESSFLRRIEDVRRREVRKIQTLLATRNAITAISMTLPVFASVLSFVTYVLSQHALDPARIFSSLALFNSLRVPLSLLPLVIGQAVDARTSLDRIEDFILAEEQKDDAIWDGQESNAITMSGASFTWEQSQAIAKARSDQNRGTLSDHQLVMHKRPKVQSTPLKSSGDVGQVEELNVHRHEEPFVDRSEPFRLHNLNFTFGRSELVAVIGSVGSGKSSLLAALVGEMRKTKGDLIVGAERAFCPQQAWFQHLSLRDNILFGNEYDEKLYNAVIEACSLSTDLSALPSGDQTEIGERGINLSGGQKQRLNIARAIYSRKSIILMDDPLSAVDAQVGQHIFEHAICGLLADRCRVLATHQLHLLSRCDKIVWMDQGRIRVIDTYEHLMDTDAEFRDMLAKTTQVEHSEPVAVTRAKFDSQSQCPENTKAVESTAPLMRIEDRAVNAVSWKVYSSYLKAAGSLYFWPCVLVLLMIAQGSNIFTSLWLSWWTANKLGLSRDQYIGTYIALGGFQALIMFSFSLALSMLGTTSSRNMLDRAMTRVLASPIAFFETTPLGRITNRFAKDIDTMDNYLTDSVRLYLLTLATILSIFILITVYFHYFAIAIGTLFIVFLYFSSYYRASAREIKRHEAVLRSNVFSRFTENVFGVTTIRAFSLQQKFIRDFQATIDDTNSAYYLTVSNQRWLALRLAAIGNSLVFTTGILTVTSRFNIHPSIVGLTLAYVLIITQVIQLTVQQLASVENAMVSTERLNEYGCRLEAETAADFRPVSLPSRWPTGGAISFKGVRMRYRENLPLVLEDIDLRIPTGQHVAFVGRTGAGKSSLISTLFRLVPLTKGSIAIDEIDIADIALHDLRTRLSIIPQDPTLFKGTIRSNLDPYNEHSDHVLWSVMRESHLLPAASSPSSDTYGKNLDLESAVEDEGGNFSLGQRQLLALARALVRDSRILVCDEATSAVDLETDDRIQQTIASKFQGRTVLCIAHRLRTILNYDRVCVMDRGRVVELDTPRRLWGQGGIFREMCNQNGISEDDFDKEQKGTIETVTERI